MIYKKISQFNQVNIYGAGFAGLVIGNLLAQENIPFKLYEKSSRSGGKLQTSQADEGMVEHAANAIFCDESLLNFLLKNGLKPIAATAKLKRKIKVGSDIFEKPIKLYQIFFILIKSLKKIPHHLNPELVSLADFLTPWLGHKIVNSIISTGLLGVYSSSANEFKRIFYFKSQPCS
jgi:protoporphyrinogen oxidase